MGSINLMFTPDTPQVRTVLNNFLTAHAARSGITLSIDSVPSSFYDELSLPTSNLGLIPVPSADFIYDYVLQNPNSTLLGINFNITGDTYKYQVFYNASLFASTIDSSDFFSPQLLYFERTLEEAIFNTTGQPTAFNITLRPFPTLPLTRVPDTLSASLGPCFFFIVTALPTVLMAMNALVGEKEKHLRRSMMLMGLRRESWYVGWYLTFALVSGLVGLILTGLGYGFGFDFFRNSNFGVVFLTFWLHSLAELSLSFFAIVWMRRTSSAVLFATFWYSFNKNTLIHNRVHFEIDVCRYILGLLFMSVVFSNGLLAYVWWSPDISAAGRWILFFVPFFNVRPHLLHTHTSKYEVMVVRGHVNRDLNPLDRRRKCALAGIHPSSRLLLVRFIPGYPSESHHHKRYLPTTPSAKLVLEYYEYGFISHSRLVPSSLPSSRVIFKRD
jgi:hypothetical protein